LITTSAICGIEKVPAPSGLDFDNPTDHGLTAVATKCRAFGALHDPMRFAKFVASDVLQIQICGNSPQLFLV